MLHVWVSHRAPGPAQVYQQGLPLSRPSAGRCPEEPAEAAGGSAPCPEEAASVHDRGDTLGERRPWGEEERRNLRTSPAAAGSRTCDPETARGGPVSHRASAPHLLLPRPSPVS